ncbi:NADH-quinone oxidoreductase subunit D [Candidatus Acetothermia bacterium]|nr:NADH-quinone oxidoreductase subunit D [Candidatus Acetothermia bacterium]MBI3643319.1 NADH-quinone oxidoreductase subunit D [Candidatus Acetothermia bacterium]
MTDVLTRQLDLQRIGTNPEHGTETMVLNLGPHHPSTHGVLRIVLELDGEVVVKSEPVIGYLHTGIEKECEYRTYHQIVPLIDRMDYLSSLNEEMGFIQAAERLFGIQAPRRAEYIRVIMAEFSRIVSHMVWLGTSALELNVSSVFMYTFRDREMILDLFEFVSGARMFPRYFRIGGVLRDLPRGFDKMARELILHLRAQIKEYDSLLTKNPIWKMRNVGVGVLTTEQCLAYGATGPVLRSTGVAYDVRKAFPYSAYAEFKFEVPTKTEGDAYSRYLLRLAEMDQSLNIIEQALNKLPSGPFVVADRKVWKPHPHKGLFAPVGESYVTIESPRGEKGYWVIGDGSNKPLRMRMRAPSFAHIQILPEMINGHYLGDAVVAIASVDPVLGDVDR